MRATVALVLLVLLASGCVESPAAGVEPLAPSRVVPGTAFSWQGAALEAEGTGPQPKEALACLAVEECEDPPAECGPRNCERRALEVHVPEGFEGRLAVAIRWPTDHSLWFLLRVEDPDGALVAKGRYTPVDHLSALALVDDPRPGTYVATVLLAYGASDYEGAARLLPDASPRREGALLPDLVTLTPADLRIEDPPYMQVGFVGLLPTAPAQPVLRAAGSKGCGPDEHAAGARRCLRFSNGVGNVGDGPLDVRLSPGDERFVQRILHADGTHEDRPAGEAEFHAAHAHFHNAGASLFTLHAYDAATGARGEAVKEGRKTGICFADIGLVDLRAGPVEPPTHHGVGCVNPVKEKALVMGLAVGWFDLYDWVVADQYLDVAGVPDGTYLLCSAANPDGALAELDAANNEACAAFRMEGDVITMLTPEPYHAWPE